VTQNIKPKRKTNLTSKNDAVAKEIINHNKLPSQMAEMSNHTQTQCISSNLVFNKVKKQICSSCGFCDQRNLTVSAQLPSSGNGTRFNHTKCYKNRDKSIISNETSFLICPNYKSKIKPKHENQNLPPSIITSPLEILKPISDGVSVLVSVVY